MAQGQTVDLHVELPNTVKAIRDGWNWTSTSGAVVSGLLAGGAAQLLSTFKGDMDLMNREPRDRNLVLVLCYAALFLNISATISSFILTDNLGELEYNTAKGRGGVNTTQMLGGEATILKAHGASPSWEFMLYHWLITFYSGILSLIMSVLSYVWLVEARSIAVTMSVIVGFTLLPTTYFILLRPFLEFR
ncbi:hypothetical protein HYPSUDRAFT_64915 [Hypholoma sublateritium FD-334 SS-4]|uniref:Uncharacterized protein n=1 Tax=Hypholoma sublateritium (strain FD-334 SS-4) TaxID=945553 RepID=A0A0D2MN22_HYPSF|nr:hypothetical protein HYPSUDRAFT_64915 [Hypholoma sublateritium FD-334 SS-4]